MSNRPYVPAAVLVAAILLANWLTTHYGFVAAGFGLVVTAGTYSAGLALVARDYVHDMGGARWVLGVIAVGAVLSFLVADPAIAAASGIAFLFSELADTTVYAPLRERRWRWAVICSSAVGALVDTVLFLWIAFGTSALTGQAVGGQLLVKVLWVAVPVAVLGGWVRTRRAVPVG